MPQRSYKVCSIPGPTKALINFVNPREKSALASSVQLKLCPFMSSELNILNWKESSPEWNALILVCVSMRCGMLTLNTYLDGAFYGSNGKSC